MEREREGERLGYSKQQITDFHILKKHDLTPTFCLSINTSSYPQVLVGYKENTKGMDRTSELVHAT